MWAKDEYDHASTWASEGDREMEEWGCAVSSAAMVLSHYGVNHPDTNDVTNPQNLNEWLTGEPDGYVRNGLTNWLAITRYARLSEIAENSPTSLEYIREGYSENNVSGWLDNDPSNPVIVKNPISHFFPIYGENAENWLVSDPLAAVSGELAKTETLVTSNIFLPSNTDLSYMMWVIEPGAVLRLYDSADNLLVTESVIEEIGGTGGVGTSVQIVYYRQPLSGTYRVEIENPSGETEQVEMYFYNQEGEVEQITDELGSGESKGWEIEFDKEGEDIVSWVELDIIHPMITWDQPVDGLLVSGSVMLQASCDEKCDYVNFWWRHESESYSNIAPDRRYHYERNNGESFSWTLNTLEAERWGDDPSYDMKDGIYYLYAAGKDVSGNWARTSEITIEVDHTAPNAPKILIPNEDEYKTSTPILNDWSDVGDVNGVDYYRIEYQYDDQHTFSGYPYRTTTDSQRNHTPAVWEQGGVKYRVQAWDLAGNEGDWSEWRHYYYDPEPPTNPGEPVVDDDWTNSLIQTWSWSPSSDVVGPVTGYYNRVYDLIGRDFLGDWYWMGDVLGVQTNLLEGLWSLDIRSQDAAGHYSGVSSSSMLTVDTTAPSVPIMLGFLDPNLRCDAVINERTVTVDWSDANDNYGMWRYNYEIDYPLSDEERGLWRTYFDNSEYRGSLNEGLHIIRVRAQDLAGNYSDWSDECGITYDSIVPSLVSKTSFGDQWYNTPQTAYFQYEDANLGLSYSDPWCEINVESASSYCYMTPNVCDMAGNCNNTQVFSDSIGLDMTKPGVVMSEFGTRISGTASDSLSGVERVEIRLTKPGESETTVTAVGTTSWTYTIEPASVGNYQIYVTAYDNAGNASDEIAKNYDINESDPPSSDDSGSGDVEGVTTSSTPIPTYSPALLGSFSSKSEVSPSLSVSASPSITPEPNESASPDPEVLGESDELRESSKSWWWLLLLLFPSGWYYYRKRK